jgi:dolichyl-phosphate-mannose-protein mannosyltransferase
VEVKHRFLRVIRWEYFFLCLIVVATLAMHFSIISKIKEPILDEVYYAGYYPELHGDLHYGDAYAILNNRHDDRPEHPPLSKLFIAAGIKVLGDNPWGWRVPSVIMGTLSLVLFFFICRRLQMSRLAVNMAVFLLAFENFNFMMSSIAMLDVFMVTLTLAFFLLYLYRRYLFSGVFIGLAALTKLIAVLGAPSLFIHWLFTRQKHTRWFIAAVVMAPISFVLFLTLFDWLISGQLTNPVDHIKQMLSLSSSLTFYNVQHPNMARPWEWLLNYRPMAFGFGPYPAPGYPNWLGGYTAAISLAIWPLVIPIVLYLTWRALRGNDAALFGIAWFIGTFVIWIPLSIATNRVSFIFYYLPTIGCFCLGLGLALSDLIRWVARKRKLIKIPVWAGISVIILAHLATFVVLTPVFLRG